MLRAMSDADRLIGRLGGEGRTLPNPHILMRPFIRREAVLSSKIEGTRATLGELLAAEAGDAIDRSPDDLREVANYVTALERGIELLNTLPLSLRLVREIHGELMKGVRGGHATPGEFRRSQNWIGPPGNDLSNASYVPPPPDEMIACLGAWEGFLHDRSLPPLVQAAMMHYQFEAIHPFLDGNGRVGRLMVTLFLLERRILPTPLLYLSAFFEATRRHYYDHLTALRYRDAWGPWIEYFLNGVARMSEDALGRAERINAVLERWHRDVAGIASKLPSRIIDLLAENPFWTAKKLAERTGAVYSTIQRTLDKLEVMSIVTPTSEAKRGRVFCAKEIMAILDEPAKLTPGEPV